MSELRKQLQWMRRGYGEQRYPGNLSEDVLLADPLGTPAPRTTWVWRLAVSGLAAAAILAVAFWMQPAAVTPNPITDATVADVEPGVAEEPVESVVQDQSLSVALAESPEFPAIGSLWEDESGSDENIVPSLPVIDNGSSEEPGTN